jgi:CDP-diacylglycerol--glycerol-3-phosphate 3-phosphatidyltransferase
MERAERFVFLAIGLAFNVLVPVLWVMLALTSFTAIQRFVRVYRQAGRPPRPAHARPEARSRPLRSWWATRGADGERPRRRHPSERRRARP